MKKHEIQVGGIYTAKVSNKLTTVRVESISERDNYSGRSTTCYRVTNLSTGREVTFRSAMRFRSVAREEKAPAPVPADQASDFDGTISRLSPQTKAEVETFVQGCEGEAGEECPGCAASVATPTAPTSALASKIKEALSATSDLPPHVIVEARAGTGKTTTLVAGLQILRGGRPTDARGREITPSPQQKAVWDAIAMSKGASSVCFVAFNKSIASELQSRVPNGCEAMTMHSMGFKAVTKHFGRQEPTAWVVKDLIAEILGRDPRELQKDPGMVTLLSATEELVGHCKKSLVDPTDLEALEQLCSHHDIELNGSKTKVFDLVPKVIEMGKRPRGKITFDDMIWLPVVLGLPVFRYDLLLVDEAQDLNRCQQALAKMAGRRLILCGDPKQAIYGFAGADCESMSRMEAELKETPVGCLHLPLTVTRRCGKVIVEEARKIVPDFEAFETNPQGKISSARMQEAATTSGQNSNGVQEPRPLREGEVDYRTFVKDGDMVLCRVNAPLIQQCFRFLREGRKATIQGRDVGKNLTSTIKKLKAESVVDLVSRLSDWLASETQKENAKRNPSEQRLISLQDRYDCILAFTEGQESVEGVLQKIDSIFTDNRDNPGIRLSSVHKAKGLEAHRVFILQPKGASMPHPMAKKEWAREQEMNLKYVAVTRAVEELIWVS